MTLRLQQGGTLPFTEYLPFTGGAAASDTNVPAAGGSTASTSADMQKDFLKLLGGIKGLPNETAKLIESIQDIYNDASLYNNGELDTQTLTSTYLSTLAKTKALEFNAGEFDDAKKEVIKNGGLHEFAIDETGRIVVQNEQGKIKHMTLQDYYKQGSNPEYRPLTNSNLLYYRSQAPQFAFDNSLLHVVSNGIGQEKVTDLLQKALAKVGSDTLQTDGYTVRQQSQITKGLSILQDLIKEGKSIQEIYGNDGLLSLDGVYKTNQLTSDQKQQISSVADYLWKSMPENARTWLSLRSGNTINPQQGAYEMMLTLLFASNKHVSNFSADFQKDLNPDGTKKSSSEGSSSSGTDLDPVKAFILGKGYQQPITFNNGTSVAITVNGRYSTLVDHSGKQLGNDATLQDVTNSTFAPVLDFNNASMGGQLLNNRGLDRVLLNNADIVGVDLPIDQEAAQQGIIKPDFQLTKLIEQAEYKISTEGIQDPEQINSIYAELGLPPKFRIDGRHWVVNELNYRRFAAMQGMAEESAFNEDPTFDDTLQEVLDTNQRQGFERAMNKGGEKKYAVSDGFFGLGATNIFAGTIFIPVRENSIAASLGSRDYYQVPVKDATTIEAMEQEAKRTSSYIKAPTLSSLMQ